ncbi:MAG: substrate-binding domain-containing protein, partial [Chloroflexota bacterium]
MIQKSASAYERHQSILQLLDAAESVRVVDLATRLNVSESTIRTDLETLDAQGQLTRVRGGAVAIGATETPATSELMQKVSRNSREKEWIARWAASMVEDGDTIMLDASSTVMHIARYLTNRQRLIVFTNGVHVAQMLAREVSNTVILLGGILRPNGNALTGEISEAVLRDYHIQRAFVSCWSFVPEIGFFESDIPEAQMKTLMLKATQERIALFDSSKIGSVGLTTFARLDDVDYVAVDTGVDATTIEQIRQTGTTVVVCGEQTSRTYGPSGRAERVPRIGFANLSEHTSFSRDVRRGIEEAARVRGVELVLADNQLDGEVALRVAENLLHQDLDLVIEYQIDEATGNLIAHQFQQHGIPVIAVDIPMVGATYFGVDNYVAGQTAGLELGQRIQEEWGGTFDTLIVVEQSRAGKLPAMRLQGQIDGLESVLSTIPDEKTIVVDFDNTVENAHEVIRGVLSALPPQTRIAMICFNDDAAVGALAAARETQHIGNLRLVGQGADRRLRSEMRRNTRALVGATAFCPEMYGDRLLQLALDILDGCAVAVFAEANAVDLVVVGPEAPLAAGV